MKNSSYFCRKFQDMENVMDIEKRREVFWAKIRKAAEDKDALCQSDDIEKTAKERGIKLVCPI